MNPFICSCFLLLQGRFCLLALLLFLGTRFLRSGVHPFLSMLLLQSSSHQSATLAHLDFLSPHNVVIWTVYGRLSMFKFSQSSLHHSASSVLVLAAPTSLPFLFSNSCSVYAIPFSPPSSASNCGRSGRNCLLFPVLSGCNGSPDTRFSLGTMLLISWPDGERYLCFLKSLVVSLLLSLVSTFIFSRTGGILCLLNSLSHSFLQFQLSNLCSLVMLCPLLSQLQRTQLTVKLLSH